MQTLYIHTYTYIYIYTYMHACIHTYIHNVMFCKHTPSRRPSTCCSLQVPGCPSTDISSWTLREKLCSSAGLGHPEPKTGQGGDKKWQDGLASVKGMVWAWNPQIFEDRAPPEICGVRALTPLMRREDGWVGRCFSAGLWRFWLFHVDCEMLWRYRGPHGYPASRTTLATPPCTWQRVPTVWQLSRSC